MNTLALVPKPQSVRAGEGAFHITNQTVIVAVGDAVPVAELLGELLRAPTGFHLPVVAEGAGSLQLLLRDGYPEESYQLHVEEGCLTLEAGNQSGLFRGLQTVRQLLPVEIESRQAVHGVTWAIPALTIEDAPRFGWRGLHLDVARHFFDVNVVKKFIDVMALYKFNVFHWHLTDDQGWRIEIKQYPKLTEIGSQRSETPIPANRHQGDGKPYNGFYTQDEIREVVAYAAARSIIIVPEIEMPGHALAALASYPELGCVGSGYAPWTKWGIADDVFCAGKEEVFAFLEDVLTEVLELFPSEFIHVGGDECPKERWENCPHCQARIKAEGLADEHELQSYFIQRMEKWLNAHGRRLIGWDEILEGGLAPNATVMSWRGSQGGIDAANAGHDVVMTPTTHCYLDYYQSEDTDNEPAAIGEYLPLERVYQYQPIPLDIDPAKAHHVLGGQGNVWSEYLPSGAQVEYMVYPRAAALAEILWSYPTERNFEDFFIRMSQQQARLEFLGVNYRKLRRGD
ncbi:MAG: beta-N-acetylhexosaminidase [Anaerolineae bacterium]